MDGEPLRHNDTVAKNLRHTLFTWTAQTGLDPIEIVSAEGSHFKDAKGRRILDLASLALNSFLAASRRIRTHLRTIEVASGIVLILFGILLVTDLFPRFVSFLSRFLPAVG